MSASATAPSAATVAAAASASSTPSAPDLSSAYNARSETVCEGTHVRIIVFFDVDGTLVRNAAGTNTVHRDSFTYALKKVYGVDAHIDEIPHQGMTDMWIIDELLESRGFTREQVNPLIPACVQEMINYCGARRDAINLLVLPGVRELLAQLAARKDVLLGLVTGNIEQIAIWKMQSCGLMEYFSFGGFGSDHRSRGELIQVALRRALALYPGLRQVVGDVSAGEPTEAAAHSSTAHHVQAAGVRVFHVGDTRHDLMAALHANVTGIGVATGGFSEEELAKVEGSHVILPDLTDRVKIMSILGLSE